MAALRILFNMAYADFLERARRYSFLIAVGIAVLAGIACVPGENSTLGIMCFSGYRGVYNTAWVSYSIALTTSIVLSLFGFFLIKNTIERDNRTGVGQIIACTSVSNMEYCVGKMLSNVLLLSIISFIMMFMSLIMQQVRGEETSVDLWYLTEPFLYITLPTVVFISALAVFFETFNLLKHGFGNIVYFFIWILFIAASGSKHHIFDLTGGSVVISQIQNDLYSTYQNYNGAVTVIGSVYSKGTFIWNGVKWTFFDIAFRFCWILLSVIIIYMASNIFDRFSSNSQKGLIKLFTNNDDEPVQAEKNKEDKTFLREFITPIYEKFHFGQLLFYESLALLKGLNLFWYITLFVLLILSFTFNIEITKGIILPVIFLAVSIICSKVSSKEVVCKTEQLVFHTPYFNRYQMIAEFMAISMLFTLSAIGVIIRYLISGMWVYIISLIFAAFLISSLLLLLGVVSKDSKLFEVFIIIALYIGPLQNTYPLDFVSLSGVHKPVQYWVVICTICALLLCAAYLIRKGKRDLA